MMIRSAVHRVENHALIGVRTERRLACAVGNLRLMTVKRSVGIRHVIDSVSLVNPHRLEEILNALDDVNLSVVRNHVFV